MKNRLQAEETLRRNRFIMPGNFSSLDFVD